MAAKPKNFGKGGQSAWVSKLRELEALAGSQKNLAASLGVHPSTLRRWKKKPPSQQNISRVNRMYGQRQRRKTEIKTLDLKVWVRKYLGGDILHPSLVDWFIREARDRGLHYAMFSPEQPSEAQFVSMDQYISKKFGKPAKTRSVQLFGTIEHYNKIIAKDSLVVMRRDLLSYMRETWDIRETLEKARGFFYEEAESMIQEKMGSWQQRDEPQIFIGYFYA